MKKFYVPLLLFIFLLGCAQQNMETPEETEIEEGPDISKTTGVSDAGAIDEELDAKSLGTLEEDLTYIEKI